MKYKPVIFITCALFCEAKPIIDFFGLKLDTSFNKFNIYKNEDIVLTVSGTGMLKASIATACMLVKYQCSSKDASFNIGICGSVNTDIPNGTPILCNKIINHDTGRAFYPDILIKHSFLEGTLETFSFPVKHVPIEQVPVRQKSSVNCSAGNIYDLGAIGPFIDMEAAGFAESASVFCSINNIFIIKVVSDYLEGNNIEKDFVYKTICENIPGINEMFNKYRALSDYYQDMLSNYDLLLLDKISNSLKLTETMKHQLKNYARGFKLKNSAGLEVLESYSNYSPLTKVERRNIFNEIKELLTK